jgi:hypothetical protein
MLLSIVIPNYNYAEYVGQAIQSALGLDWPNLEVIVVDDGSTDASRAVIERYRERITLLYQENSGQRVACNVGFAKSRGDVVIFLDADDVLDPSLGKELARVWRPGVSKVQFQMQIIDASGKPTGAVLPQYDVLPSAERIRSWVKRAGAYPTPPGSGNAYARSFLEQLFPLEGEEEFSDSYCLAAAPYLGDVLTIAKPLVCYRVHGRNAGAMTRVDASRFAPELLRAEWRFRYARGCASLIGLELEERAFQHSLTLLPYRLASIRLSPEQHPLPGDTPLAVLRQFFRAFFVDQGIGIRARAALLVWAACVALGPRELAEQLVLWRFASSSRPAGLRHLLRWLTRPVWTRWPRQTAGS